MIFTIVGVAFIGVIINLILKNTKPELAVLSNLVTVLIILSCVLELVGGVITKIMTYISGLGIGSEIFVYLFKILGISYIIEFMVDIAEDSGSVSIANKVALAGKIVIASLSLPVLFDLIDVLLEIV